MLILSLLLNCFCQSCANYITAVTVAAVVVSITVTSVSITSVVFVAAVSVAAFVFCCFSLLCCNCCCFSCCCSCSCYCLLVAIAADDFANGPSSERETLMCLRGNNNRKKIRCPERESNPRLTDFMTGVLPRGNYSGMG